MSVANIFNRDVEANKGPRNVFDIGYSSIFSTPCGMILPAYVEDVKQGDKLSLSCSNVCRTRPVNTSAFMAFDERVDFWYVPYYLIWSAYEQWRLSQSYPHSSTSLTQVGNQVVLPSSSWTSLFTALRGAGPVDVDDFTTFDIPSALRLLDLLNYGAVPHSSFSALTREESLETYDQLAGGLSSYCYAMDSAGFVFNYFRLAAFQCIYMHGYRNEEYEKLDPTFYNCDSLFQLSRSAQVPSTGSPVPTSYSHPSRLLFENPSDQYAIDFKKLLTPRFKNWRRDLFTSLKPDSGFSALTSAQIPNPMSGSSFAWPSSLPTPSGQYSDSFTTSDNTTANLPVQLLGVDGSDAYLYAQNIYNILAQDKFSRSMIYADKNYRDQMKAVFGSYDDDDLHLPQYLGSYSCDVSISDVVATSAGTDGDSSPATSVLGEIAGKGYGNNSDKVFERSFPKDGVVIGVHYIMPRNNYDSYRISRFNTKSSRFDYYYPQFDGLGLQPTFAYERNLFSYPYPAAGPGALQVGSLLGFSPRYAEYKTRQSETHGSFMHLQPDYDWTLSNNGFAILSGSSVYNYKISPEITDRLFSVAYDGSMMTDPFICYFSFDVKRVSNMEIFGTPSL